MTKYAICNELFENWTAQQIARCIASLGYTGVEIAPFTLVAALDTLTPSQIVQHKLDYDREGIQIIGLHWLLAQTEGMNLTSPDNDIRKKTGSYLAQLARYCRALGGDILVLGSPKQRSIPPGFNKEQIDQFALDTLEKTLKVLEQEQVYLCLEPLGPMETNYLNTAAEAVQLAQRLNSPFVQLHLDVKAMSTEKTPIPELIQQFAPQMKHFHANDPNRRGPGMGEVDFVPIFQSLEKVHYSGWVSVEVFDYSDGAEVIAKKSIEYMKRCEAKTKNI